MIDGSAAPSCALDASALLATVHREPGAEVVRQHLEDAVISAVNWAEVVQKALARGADVQQMRAYIDSLRVLIVPFDADAADAAARLWTETRRAGLSLADRCCLVLAGRLGIPALTTDRAWAQLTIGVDIRVIR
jgi:PIN domain nuclease of toxin-antitoxin system